MSWKTTKYPAQKPNDCCFMISKKRKRQTTSALQTWLGCWPALGSRSGFAVGNPVVWCRDVEVPTLTMTVLRECRSPILTVGSCGQRCRLLQLAPFLPHVCCVEHFHLFLMWWQLIGRHFQPYNYVRCNVIGYKTGSTIYSAAFMVNPRLVFLSFDYLSVAPPHK